MDERNKGDMSKPRMVRSSSKRAANKPARNGPGDDAAVPDGNSGIADPDDGAGNTNLGSLKPVSRGRRKPAPPRLRPLLDALFRDTAAAAEAARRWSDGPGRLWRESLPPEAGTAAALEHLNIHTRLMQVMNWLLQPAHNGAVSGVQPFDHPACPPLADGHPIRTVEGVKLAEASRALHARAAALAAAHPIAPDDEEA
jgi:hypothetical protein